MTKVTLYYENDSNPKYQELYGRALTQDEYDNISFWELQEAICHSGAASCIFDIDRDWRFTPEFYDLSLDELKQKLKENGAIIIRAPERLWRNDFPLFTRGLRKGMPNFKKEPEVYKDRLYIVEFEDELIAREGEIEENDDGTFTVVESVQA